MNPSMLSLPGYALPVATGLTSHALFKIYEPKSAKIWTWLLLGLPIAAEIAQRRRNIELSSALLSVVAHLVTLVSSIIIYRLSPFHPLAKYPGPRLARISNLWMIRVTLSGKRHLVIVELHRKYGTHVRIGPNIVSIAELTASKQCLGPHGLPKSSGARSTEPDHMSPSLVSSLSASVPGYDHAHSQQRATWGKGFTTTTLQDYDVYISARAVQLVERLGEISKFKAVNLSEWFSFFTFDFMGDLVFGGGFTMLQDGGDRRGHWRTIRKVAQASSYLTYLPWLNNHLSHVPLPAVDGLFKLQDFAVQCIRSRQQRSADIKDLLYYIAKEDIGKSPPLEMIISDSFLAIAAGADTTSGVLANLFHLLARNKQVLDKLRVEIDANFGLQEDIKDMHVLAHLPYLNACINETLRIAPIVPVQIVRTPHPGSGGVEVAGMFVPEGTSIYLPVITLHRSPRYFSPSPDKFWPERWLSPPPDCLDFIHNREAFMPFSYGPANCVGKHLAYREVRLVTARMIRNFEMHLEKGFEPREELLEVLEDNAIFQAIPLPVKLVARST